MRQLMKYQMRHLMRNLMSNLHKEILNLKVMGQMKKKLKRMRKRKRRKKNSRRIKLPGQNLWMLMNRREMMMKMKQLPLRKIRRSPPSRCKKQNLHSRKKKHRKLRLRRRKVIKKIKSR
jgi:hypothetical protein